MNQEMKTFQNKKDGILIFLWVGVGYLLFCSALPSLMANQMAKYFSMNQSLCYLLFAAVTAVIFIVSLYKGFGEEMELSDNISLGGIVEALLVGLVLFFVVNLVISPVLAQIFKTSGENYSESVKVMFQRPVVTFFQVVVLAPCMEELIFRGFLLKRALRWRTTAGAVLIVAAFFGILHLSVVQGLSAFGAGIILCLLYAHRKSVFLCILAHGFYNGLAYVLTLLGGIL